MDRELLPGTKLIEASLCKQYACSRSNVRLALQWLAHDQIVQIIPNRGAFVHAPDVKEVRDVFAMRVSLEKMLIDMLIAMPRLDEKLQPLYQNVAQEQLAFEEGRRGDWIRWSNAFHIELARMTHNQVLLQIMRNLCLRTSLIIAMYDTPCSSTCSYSDHTRILDLLSAGKRKVARREMKHHLLECVERIDNQLPRPCAHLPIK